MSKVVLCTSDNVFNLYDHVYDYLKEKHDLMPWPHRYYSDKELAELKSKLFQKVYKDNSYFLSDRFRTSPELFDCIDHFGGISNIGDDLKIVEIPEDIEWYIAITDVLSDDNSYIEVIKQSDDISNVWY